MPKYQVWLDKGVKIGGKRYQHGELVDSDSIGKPEPTPPLVPNATEEQKAAHAAELEEKKKKAEEESKQAKEDLDAAVKAGHLAPPLPAEKPEEKKATDTKKKEG